MNVFFVFHDSHGYWLEREREMCRGGGDGGGGGIIIIRAGGQPP